MCTDTAPSCPRSLAEGAQVRFLEQIFCLFLVVCQVEAGGVNVVFVRERPLLEQGVLVLPTRFLRGHVQTGTTNPARVHVPGKDKQEEIKESSRGFGVRADVEMLGFRMSYATFA